MIKQKYSVKRILKRAACIMCAALMALDMTFAPVFAETVYEVEEISADERYSETAVPGYDQAVTDLWELQQSLGALNVIYMYGPYYPYRYYIIPEDSCSADESSINPYETSYSMPMYDYNTVIVESDALDEEDLKYLYSEYDDYYVLAFDDADTARDILEKYDERDDAQASYDAYAEIFHDGSLYPAYAYTSYGPEMIGADDITKLLAEKYPGFAGMRTITVAVLDTGINFNHFLFSSRIGSASHDYYPEVTKDDNGNTIYDDGDPTDPHGHGSHVAGIIADTTLYNVQLNIYKVTNSKGATSAARLKRAIDQAAADGVDIINMSLGGPMSYEDEAGTIVKSSIRSVYSSIDQALSQGIMVICASGNTGIDVANYYPANYSGTIAVSAVDVSGNNLASYSNYGAVDVSAPGSSILSAAVSGSGYASKSGTSMAAPFVSGAAALLMSYYPEYGAGDVEAYFQNASYDLGPAGYDSSFGYGRVDLSLKEEAPELSVPEGEYEGSFSLSLTCGDDNASIYYTLDGSDPDPEDNSNTYKYTSALEISQGTIIKAVTYRPFKITSDVTVGRYYVNGENNLSDFETDGKGNIIRYTGTQTNMKIPAEINGEVITGIGDKAFFDDIKLRVVTLPESIVNFGTLCFNPSESSSVQVYLEGDVKSIGEYPFGYNADVYYKLHSQGTDMLEPYGYSIVCINPNDHEYEEKTITEPDCTQPGLFGEVCSICGEIGEARELPAEGHDLEKYVSNNSRCTGLMHCKNCDKYYTDSDASRQIDAADIDTYADEHHYVFVSYKAPTCGSQGNTAYWKCDKCGKFFMVSGTEYKVVDEEETVIPKTDHLLHEYPAVQASCTQDGNIQYWQCDVCSEVFIKENGNYVQTELENVIISAAGHTEVTDAGISPTCLMPGLTAGSHCSTCGQILTAQASIPAAGHSYELYETISEASCTEAGKAIYKCSACGDTYTLITAPAGHAAEYTQAIEPTCVSDGQSAGARCAVCSETLSESVTIPAAAHDLVFYSMQSASCTEPGHIEYAQCNTCGQIFIENNGSWQMADGADLTIPAHGHVECQLKEIPATCTHTGWTAGSYCVICGEVLAAQYEIPVTEHSLIYYNEKPATCTQIGWYAFSSCENCDYTTYVEIPAAGHDYQLISHEEPWSEWIKTGEFTDEEIEAEADVIVEEGYYVCHNGYDVYQCSICEDQYTVPLHIAEHDAYLTHYDGQAPTCRSEGWLPYDVCSQCAAEGMEFSSYTELQMSDHTLQHIDHVPASCGWDGHAGNIDYWLCSECGGYFAYDENGMFTQVGPENVTITADHKFVQHYAVSADCRHSGNYEYWVCSECGGYFTFDEYSDFVQVNYENLIIPQTAHTEVWYNEISATCTTSGITQRSYCSVCSSPVLEGSYTACLGHDPVFTAVLSEADCIHDGITEYECSRCGQKIYEKETALGHSPQTDPAADAGCETKGLTEGTHCSVCGRVIVPQYTVLSAGHDLTFFPAGAGVCGTDGHKAYWYCSSCGKYFAVTQDPQDGSLAVSEVQYSDIIVPDTGHKLVLHEALAARCWYEGMQSYQQCSVCEKLFTADGAEIASADVLTVEKTEHTVAADEAFEADCLHPGLKAGSHCSVCGEVLTSQEEIKVSEHEYGAAQVIIEPECSHTGQEKYTCKNCKNSYLQDVPALEHTLVTDEAVKAQCLITGLTEGKHCSVCGEVVEAQQKIPADGHKLVHTGAIEPACTQEGMTEEIYCEVCGKVIEEQTILEPLGHNYTSQVTAYADCTSSGVRTFTCTRCGDQYTESIPAGGHVYRSSVTKEPDCASEGILTYTCVVCGASYTESIAQLTAHTPVNDPAVPATCTGTGLTQGSHCSVCGQILVSQKTIPLTEHTLVNDPAVPATCTDTGLTQGSHCSVCGTVINAQTVIPAAGHNYEATVTQKAAYTQAGVMTYTCRVCGESYTEIIPATGFEAPAITGIRNTKAGVRLTWESTGAAKYRIFRKAGSGKWVKLADVKSLKYTDKTAKSGTTYTYRIRSISSDKTKYTSSSSAKKKIKFIAAPVLKKISRTKYGVRLTWKASKGAAKYRIYRKTGNGKWIKLADVTSLKYVDTTVKKGVKYTYTVRCISANGKKATSGYNTRGLSIKYY